ncbi:MAG TPA: hypothetical protein PKA13_15970 [Geminicoccaceae bacterium]|mgnify:CR=1 FL=1|nr:hypothetical protein [Geminicoccus sp.]HMU51272.1 hypothetical protein [Geminicoccaceae bacterium]
MWHVAQLGMARPLVLFASGAGVGRVVESWRRGGLVPAGVDVTEPDLRSALLAETALAELRMAGIPVSLRLAPNTGTPTRLEIAGVLGQRRDALYMLAGPSAFVLRLQRMLHGFGVEAAELTGRSRITCAAA